MGDARGDLDAGVAPEQLPRRTATAGSSRRRRRRGPAPTRRAGSANATVERTSCPPSSRPRPSPRRRGRARRGWPARDRDPDRVEVDAGAGDPGPRERHQVAADAAAQVDHGLASRRPSAAPRGASATGEPGRLLEPVGGEVHPGREVAELGLGPPPQLDLGQRRRDLLGGRAYAGGRSAPPARRPGASAARASSCCPSSVSSQRNASRSIASILSEARGPRPGVVHSRARSEGGADDGA